jgi:GNAT superfamily N-acetyltransferase
VNITFREECIGAHHGQLDLVLYAFIDKKPVGSIEHVRFNEKVYISMIFVDPYFRRRGIATALWAELERLNPGRPIVIGNKTDDGEKFFRALKRKDG